MRSRPRCLTCPPSSTQKNCKCCWAIAAADNIEALWRIKHRQSVEVSVQGMAGRRCVTGKDRGSRASSPLLSLSAPELLDCDRCGNGCHGGFVWDAYVTVLNNS